MGESMFKKRDNQRTQAAIPVGFAAYTGECFSRPQMRTIYLRVERPAREATARSARPEVPLPAPLPAVSQLPMRPAPLEEGR